MRVKIFKSSKPSVTTFSPLMVLGFARDAVLLRALGIHNEYAAMAAATDRILKTFANSVCRKIRLLTSSRVGREFVAGTIVESARMVLGDEKVVGRIESELRTLVNDGSVRGGAFVRSALEIVAKHVKDRNALRRIRDISTLAIYRSYVSRDGSAVADLVLGKLYYSENGVVKRDRVSIASEREEVEAVRKLAEKGIRIDRIGYVEDVLGSIAAKALAEARSAEDFRRRFCDELRKRLMEDSAFARAFLEYCNRLQYKMYSVGALVAAFAEVLAMLPRTILAMVARVLQRAASMMPIVGAVLATQAEAAALVSELGEAIADRIRTAGQTWVKGGSLEATMRRAGEELVFTAARSALRNED